MRHLFSLLLAVVLLLCSSACAFAEAAEGADVRLITLTGKGAKFSCDGVRAEGSIITITEPGDYLITGSLTDGQLRVDVGFSEVKTTVTLSGVTITNLSDAAIYIVQAEKVRLCMEEGTENVITSGTREMLSTFSKNNTGAAIYSEDDFDIKGPGVLVVYGFINNGIMCRDDLDIDGGSVIVYAANNGIRGSESVEINDGDISVSCGNDGLKATSVKPGKGYVEIDGGRCNIAANGNGISAETDILVYGGETVIESQKAPLKAGGNISVFGGSLIGNGAEVW